MYIYKNKSVNYMKIDDEGVSIKKIMGYFDNETLLFIYETSSD